MIRSLSICVALARQNVSYNESKRMLLKFYPVITQYVAARSLHLTTTRFSEDDTKTPKEGKEKKSKLKPKDEKTLEAPVNEEMKEAVVKVAKSLPGDWTRTAEDLLARLQLQHQPETESQEEGGGDKSLLSTMEVGRFMDQKPRRARMQRGRGGQQMEDGRQQARPSQRMEDDLYGSSVVEKVTQQRRRPRRQENFIDLFKDSPRLGIFDAEKLKKEGESLESVSEPEDLWHQTDLEHLRRVLGGVPRNGFEEMAQWTKEGKLWKFPIDNESDMHEERKYKFYDHVFLEQYLTEFPEKGPIRKFMELVTLGLSNNPYISPPEKVEHIRWYAQYFREKQDIIEAAVGKEQARMKETEQGKLE